MGIGTNAGTVLLILNEGCVAEDRRERYRLTLCPTARLNRNSRTPFAIRHALAWNEVMKVANYNLSVDAMTQPMQVGEERSNYKP